jgi:hypothetical protein
MKGKNFSCNNQGKRRKADFYETPYSMTKQLLRRIDIPDDSTILEPACGDGAILKELKENGTPATTFYDITMDGQDFFEEKERFDFIITNPPYSKALEFIEKALTIATNTFMLLPLNYLHGQRRYESGIWKHLDEIMVFTRYPLLGDPLRQDGKYRTGMMSYAWYFFMKDEIGRTRFPTIRWIDNNEFVIGKNCE